MGRAGKTIQPAALGVSAKTLALEKRTGRIQHEVTSTQGGSVKDQTERIEVRETK